MEPPVAIAAGRGSDAASTDRSACLGRLARSAPNGGEKQKEILLFATFFRSDPRDARDDEERESVSLSLLVRRRSDSRFPTRGEVSSDGYSKRREGRSVLDPTTKTRVRAENFQALQKCDSVARASFRGFSVCSGYPASFFGPWLCACVWHESMLLSCVWRASRDRRVG